MELSFCAALVQGLLSTDVIWLGYLPAVAVPPMMQHQLEVSVHPADIYRYLLSLITWHNKPVGPSNVSTADKAPTFPL